MNTLSLKFSMVFLITLASIPAQSQSTYNYYQDPAKIGSSNPVATDYFIKGFRFIEQWGSDDADSAIVYMQKAIEADSLYAMAWATLGHLLKYKGYDATSISMDSINRLADKALQINPNLGDALTLKSWVYFMNNDVPMAIELCKRATRVEPENRETWLWLGIRYLELPEKADSAIWAFNKSLEVDSLFGQPHLKMGWLYLDGQDYEKAEFHFREAIRLYEQVKPRDNRLIAGYMGLGYVQEDLGRLDEALETFKTLLAHCANSDIHSLHVYRNAAHKELAFIYSKKADEEINKLIDYNEYRIAEHPNDYQLLNDIGAFYEKVELAISNVARVDTIHTLRIELYQNILNNTGIPDEMVDAAYQLVKIHSNDHDFAKVSTVLNLLENRINKADQLNLYSLYNLACTYALARKTDQAISYLDRSIKEGFDQFDWAKNDPDLESIRDLDQFKKLVNKKQ